MKWRSHDWFVHSGRRELRRSEQVTKWNYIMSNITICTQYFIFVTCRLGPVVKSFLKVATSETPVSRSTKRKPRGLCTTSCLSFV